jgi:hypothetical protein
VTVDWLKRRLTYANVISTLCLFLLLGGGAYAASHLGKNTVGTKQLKKNAVTGAKVKDQSLTGKDIDLSKLGTVPNAQLAVHADTAGDSTTLQGNGPGAFIHGGGTQLAARLDLNEFEEVLFLNLPGFGRLEPECHVPGVLEMTYKNSSGGTVDYSQIASNPTLVEAVPDGGETGYVAFGSESDFVQIATRGGSPKVATIELTETASGPKACGVFAEATILG